MQKPCNSTDKEKSFFYAKDKTLIELNFPLISKLCFRVFSFHHLLKLLNRIFCDISITAKEDLQEKVLELDEQEIF